MPVPTTRILTFWLRAIDHSWRSPAKRHPCYRPAGYMTDCSGTTGALAPSRSGSSATCNLPLEQLLQYAPFGVDHAGAPRARGDGGHTPEGNILGDFVAGFWYYSEAGPNDGPNGTRKQPTQLSQTRVVGTLACGRLGEKIWRQSDNAHRVGCQRYCFRRFWE